MCYVNTASPLVLTKPIPCNNTGRHLLTKSSYHTVSEKSVEFNETSFAATLTFLIFLSMSIVYLPLRMIK